MAKLTLAQKADRVLKLLLGVQNPRVLTLLASRGFTAEDLDEGWRLLRGLAKVTFDAPLPRAMDANQVKKLDEWENTWFPVADATLSRRFPAVHEQVFLNLSQTEGSAVIISVGTFLERIAALRDGDDQRKQAARLLERRGLTRAVLDEARSLLEQLGRPASDGPTINLEAQRKDALLAQAELWSWYLEWSQITRGVIADRRLLRDLGFLRPLRGSGGNREAEAQQEEPPPDAAPGTPGVPALAGAPSGAHGRAPALGGVSQLKRQSA